MSASWCAWGVHVCSPANFKLDQTASRKSWVWARVLGRRGSVLVFGVTHKHEVPVRHVSDCMSLSAASTKLDHPESRGPPVEQISRAGVQAGVSHKLRDVTVLGESVSVCVLVNLVPCMCLH